MTVSQFSLTHKKTFAFSDQTGEGRVGAVPGVLGDPSGRECRLQIGATCRCLLSTIWIRSIMGSEAAALRGLSDSSVHRVFVCL